VSDVYGATEIEERHRHRYEVDTGLPREARGRGAVLHRMSPDGRLPEIVEWSGHPLVHRVQFHPELKSKPFEPHPLFAGFVRAAVESARLV
jgi:CTP synthase